MKKNTGKDNFWLFQLESSQQHEIEYCYFEAGVGRNLSKVSGSLVNIIFKIITCTETLLRCNTFSWVIYLLLIMHEVLIMYLFPNRNNFRKYINSLSSFIYHVEKDAKKGE